MREPFLSVDDKNILQERLKSHTNLNIRAQITRGDIFLLMKKYSSATEEYSNAKIIIKQNYSVSHILYQEVCQKVENVDATQKRDRV